MGGDFQGRLWPEYESEIQRAQSMGINDINQILTIDDLIKSEDVFFSATGITDGDLLRGVRYFSGRAVTHTLVMRGLSGTIRYIQATHHLDKKPLFKDNKIRIRM